MNTQRREQLDGLFKIIFKGTGILTIVLLAGIFFMLFANSLLFFLEVSPIDFFTGSQWDPETNYSILPLLLSTSLVALGSMLIAVPLGVLTAAFLSEFAPKKMQLILKPMIEMLAAIPSVAIGFLGIVLVGPALANAFGIQNGLNALNGSILLAIMALPTIVTVSEDAINAVPKSHREASYALGANKWETLFKVTLPAAMPGLIAAVMLGLGRALGETMTVLMATGNAAAIPKGFLDSVRTITATIAIEMGEVPYQTTHYFALFAIAALLFLITFIVNLLGEYFANRLRKFHA
ncbi:MAG: phosphate ABC transporter permease subunit PstC [Bacteroidetes bacterium]|jgi:phosphate transport system permease protein|nr:phosphate ABC transporter permease subunit PstC [Bacteroidota bacterium]HQW46761.1 phosphate ABC transporter permease subunit PstC [Chitinophagaceae bacterium]MBK7039325.1 phosphate ABC transporter permease subunit PstC [Bacteroidota bacterium]MBK8329034.1 phosphate ABC transporter permease subunit PstC [Bacteroidota bacterium]MBK9301044.1 phosphate ABC transporter permease subunit PstC [Bacteroidota bacterium]